MKTCKKCGSPIQDDQRFCANCGAKIEMEKERFSSDRRDFKDSTAVLSRREYYRQYASRKMKTGFGIITALMIISLLLDIVCTFLVMNSQAYESEIPDILKYIGICLEMHMMFFAGPLNFGIQAFEAVCLGWMIWSKDWKAPLVIFVCSYFFKLFSKVNVVMAGYKLVIDSPVIPILPGFAVLLLVTLHKSYKKHMEETYVEKNK